MYRLGILFSILFLSYFAEAQPSGSGHLKHFVIRDKHFGLINYYVTSRDINKRKPLLLYLDGSGDRPLFRFLIEAADHKSIMMYSTVVFNYDSLATKYHIAFISKPAVKFADTFYVRSLDTIIETPHLPAYDRALNASWRAGTASLVIDHIMHDLSVDRHKVVVMGYSEGSLVVPRVAVINKKVTHAVCFSGNGLNQFYDFIIQERNRATKGEISEAEAQRNIDTLMAVFKDIYSHPQATAKFWAGHTYKRWASFCAVDPLNYLLQLSIPIYIAHGTADNNTQILTADYIPLEFLKHGKKNLTYRTYPGYNHFFQQIFKDKPPIEHPNEALNELFVWLDK